MDIIKEIEANVIKGKFNETQELVRAAVDQGIDPNKIIEEGLSKGMGRGWKEI